MKVVVKIGTSSLTDEDGRINDAAIAKLCAEVAALRSVGHEVIVVSSGAIGAGLPVLDLDARARRDRVTLQAISAVGQTRLMARYEAEFAEHGLVAGQVLLSPFDFFERQQYLHARGTLERLVDLDVIPIINENDAVADDAIRFGDNDRIAALVAHLIRADLLVLLTDTVGLLTGDPRIDSSASLIDEIVEIDHELEALAGGAGERGSGGMASKITAAKIATWSGVTTIIAAAHRPDVLSDAISGVDGVGTIVKARSNILSARRLWIAFAVEAKGRVHVDRGAHRALAEGGSSLLAVGVTSAEGSFLAGDSVEVVDADGRVFAKGLVAMGADLVRQVAGVRSTQLPAGAADEVIHRDDLVLVP